MSKWPVVNPPIEPLPPGVNLRGTPPDPATFDGPLNEYIELHGTAVAVNTADETKEIYDANHPPAPPPPPPPPGPAPVITPISAGKPIHYEAGVIDPNITRRITKRRPPRYTV